MLRVIAILLSLFPVLFASGEAVTVPKLFCYDADGLPMNTSTEPTANAFKYTAKELSLFRGLPVYDDTARHTLPAIGNTFRTMDPYAEKYVGISPFAFCAGDPINNYDPSGMDLQYLGDIEDLNSLQSFINDFFQGSYELNIDENGFASLNCIDQSIELNDQQKSLYDALSNVINDESTTTINLGRNIGVPIGDARTSTIDMDDVEKLGNGDYVSAVGAIIHETYEQYGIQNAPEEAKDTPTKLNNVILYNPSRASKIESKVAGAMIHPERFIDSNSLEINVYSLKGAHPIGKVTCKLKDGAITSVKREKF